MSNDDNERLVVPPFAWGVVNHGDNDNNVSKPDVKVPVDDDTRGEDTDGGFSFQPLVNHDNTDDTSNDGTTVLTGNPFFHPVVRVDDKPITGSGASVDDNSGIGTVHGSDDGKSGDVVDDIGVSGSPIVDADRDVPMVPVIPDVPVVTGAGTGSRVSPVDDGHDYHFSDDGSGDNDSDDDVDDWGEYLDDSVGDGDDDVVTVGSGHGGDSFMDGARTGAVRAKVRKARVGDSGVARQVALDQFSRKRALTFTEHDLRSLDFLTRWSFGTTRQVARAGGLRDRKERRLRERLSGYEYMGWVAREPVYAGPELWYPTGAGAGLCGRSWLGGVAARRVNPSSQSHSLGLSSIASMLLSGDDGIGRVLGLGGAEWDALRGELGDGSAWLVAEREYRSRWSALRHQRKGLLPVEYRHAFGDRLREWGADVRAGRAGVMDSPELLACDPSFLGDEMWLWTLFGNYVWNAGASDPFVPVEDRGVDPVSGGVQLRADLGDRFMTADHCADMIIARARDASGAPRSLAVELELTAKKNEDDYARTLAAYASFEGRSMFERVIWLVPSVTVKKMIDAGARRIGVGSDVYSVVPFRTEERRNSFWSGADILPAVFDSRDRVVGVR